MPDMAANLEHQPLSVGGPGSTNNIHTGMDRPWVAGDVGSVLSVLGFSSALSTNMFGSARSHPLSRGGDFTGSMGCLGEDLRELNSVTPGTDTRVVHHH